MVRKIYQISDIHIRLYKRHKEYEQVFKRLFQYIEESKTEESIIVITGDVVHNKTDMSPEMIQLTSKFLKGCADLLPTALIPGNHDGNLSNSNRLDALTPIVTSLNHPNLQYWKDSGVYKFQGLTFSHFGIFDGSDKWVYAKDIKGKDKYKIALHHGPVIGSHTDLTNIETGVKVGIFDGFDLVLLGDIHSFQFLNEEKTIAYPGSIIGQNYGESVDEHGIIVWDLPNKQGEFIKIKNDYGYVTFTLNDGKCEIPSDLPKNLRVRLKYENSTNQQIEDWLKRLSKKYNIVELIKQKTLSAQDSLQSSEELLGNSRDPEFQNSIIKELLPTLNPDITKEEIQSVLDLNVETNKLLPIHSGNRNITWKPLKLEFSNMFSYGEGNEIDFGNLEGSYGIWAKNAEGKSSLFDVLCFSLYDKTTRSIKGSHILNNQKSNFHCKLGFELGGKTYFIERKGTKNEKTGAVKVDVNFWTFDEDGNEISLNGEDRDKTNYVIRDYVGTYDDFVMTALSTQYDNQNFVEKSQRDRKELLYKFLDIFIYDDLYKLAKENSKEYQVLIREMERDNLHQRSSEIYNQIQDQTKELQTIELELSSLRSKIKDGQNGLIELNKQFKPTYQEFDIDEIENDILRISKEQIQVQENEGLVKEQIRGYNQKKKQLQSEIQPLEPYSNFQEIQKSYNEIDKKVREEKQKLDLLERDLKDCKVKEEKLKNHKFDPNCQYCIDNSFVKDAYLAIEKIPELEQTKISLLDWLDIYNDGLNSAKESLTLSNQYLGLTQELQSTETKINFANEQIKNFGLKLKSLKQEEKQLYKQKEKYFEHKDQIDRNDKIEEMIEKVQKQLKEYENEESKINSQHRKIELQISQFKRDYEDCNQKLDKYLDYIKKYRIYELYLQVTSRDGIPYKIVEMVLPVLENEVNLILNSIANFNVKLEATDEKYIHAFIQYSPQQTWPIELSSGMERFILSLAFRVALSEITTLPKANFLAIDEGFGVLDQENIMQIGKLFQYLKSQYEHLICISHIDSMRDLVDKQIKIEKINGFSKVIHAETN